MLMIVFVLSDLTLHPSLVDGESNGILLLLYVTQLAHRCTCTGVGKLLSGTKICAWPVRQSVAVMLQACITMRVI